MPLYEDRRNAQNRIRVSDSCRASVTEGKIPAVRVILREAARIRTDKNRPAVIALDGWYGIDWESIAAAFREEAPDTETFSMHSCFVPAETRTAYKKPFITDDPAFGSVNENGRIEDLLDRGEIAALNEKFRSTGRDLLLYGCGAATVLLDPQPDVIVYCDKTRQPILWQMWEGKLVPFGSDKPDPGYGWKEYYYSDYHMLDHQKEFLYSRMDFWMEAVSPDSLKILPRESYDEIIRTALKYPVKEIKIFQPGPWGAYRYRDLFDVPGLECNAWNELAGPELGMMIEYGEGRVLEMPMLNLMQYQKELLGEFLTERYPRLFPMDVWLDDGYFPEPAPLERTAMPIHNHPSTGYVRRRFNEPLGRYETYYICEAYEGACTIMGYKDGADLEEWEEICRRSQNLEVIGNWRDYFCLWDSCVGDLYLIPPGTTHGHGGNQMVLEMDTCPSVAATEYSFFEYDYARPSWDDKTKTMTAKPCRMQTEHGFDNEKWRRERWVKENLLAKPKVMRRTKDFRHDRYASVPEMPFEIERFHFYTKAENSTGHRFAHIVTLTIGKRAVIRSASDPAYSADIELFQSAVIPASFGGYEIVSSDGGFCEAVLLRWKDQA